MRYLFAQMGSDWSQDAGHAVEDLSKHMKRVKTCEQTVKTSQTHMTEYSGYSLTTWTSCLVAVQDVLGLLEV
jgi:hypothetical protein